MYSRNFRFECVSSGPRIDLIDSQKGRGEVARGTFVCKKEEGDEGVSECCVGVVLVLVDNGGDFGDDRGSC